MISCALPHAALAGVGEEAVMDMGVRLLLGAVKAEKRNGMPHSASIDISILQSEMT